MMRKSESKNKRLAQLLAFCSSRGYAAFFWHVSHDQVSTFSSGHPEIDCLDADLFLLLGAHVPR